MADVEPLIEEACPDLIKGAYLSRGDAVVRAAHECLVAGRIVPEPEDLRHADRGPAPATTLTQKSRNAVKLSPRLLTKAECCTVRCPTRDPFDQHGETIAGSPPSRICREATPDP